MKISEQWLREYVSTRWNTRELVERLTMAGVEVSGATPVAALKRVIVGVVQSVAPVSDSSHLRQCTIGIGKHKTINIVCGAANVAPGMKVIVALPGAQLPSGKSISTTVIRGAESQGMICSGADLGFEDHSDGVFELEQSAPVGAPPETTSSRGDIVLEFDLTPNRGDCFSALGLAREIAAIGGARLKAPALKDVPVRSRRRLPVRLGASRDCPRYVGRVVEDINPHSITPMWLREKLIRSGIRSVHPVVDVMNYVMLELGQPMHAFDLDKLRRGLSIRRARQKETLVLLDGKEITLEPDTLLIADGSGPVALAGIMGGAHTAVGAETRNLFLESAWFNPSVIAGRGRRLGLQTEAAQRFERGVDTTLQRRAVQRASTLLSRIVGGRFGPISEHSVPNRIPKAPTIPLRTARIAQTLGLALKKSDVERIMKRLGMRARPTAGGWSVTPPPFRFDVAREIDLIEELIRVRGYHVVPERVAALPPPSQFQHETTISESRIRHVMIDRDYQEVITYSFVAPRYQSLLDPKNPPVKLSNPISADLAVMQTSLWPGLVEAVIHNLNRQQARLRLFEMGRCFRADDAGMQQDKQLAGVVCGPALPVQWGVKRRDVDFYDLKADVEALCALAGRSEQVRFSLERHPALQPGYSARIKFGLQSVGWIGSLDPSVLSHLSVNVPLYVFEIGLSAISDGKMAHYREISRFPWIRRDLAVILPLETPAQAVWEKAREVAGKLLVNLELFDEYRGEGIDSGRKSLALGLTLQDSSRTLKEAEADQVVAEVLKGLEKFLGAQQRR
jgi:phenylalanyl-tRNA synthetase beta chain